MGKRMTKTAKTKRRGRPTKDTPVLAEGILERLSSGESLTSICAAEEMPKRTTVVKWQGQHDTFATLYARARAKYGEKLDLNMSGELNVSHLSDAKLNERLLGLLAKIGVSGELAAPFLLEPLPGDDDATRH